MGFLQQMRSEIGQTIVGWTRALDPNAFPDYPVWYRDIPVPLSNFALDYPRAAGSIPIVYACVDLLATDAAALPVRFWKKGKGGNKQPIEREVGNVVDLWERANPQQSSYELKVEIQTSLDISGNAYLFIETFGQDRPSKDWELWHMPPHTIKPTVTDHRAPIAYQFMGSMVPVMIEAGRVMHFKRWHPEFTPLGMSPLEAARIAYETRYLMDRWNRTMFERGGQVSHMFTTDAAARPMSPKEIEREQDRLMAKFGGLANAMKPTIIQGLKFERAGLTHKDMGFLDSAKLTDADICRVFGIPPVIMGIKEGGGLSDAGASADLIRYWENAQRSRARLRDSVITKHLCSRFDPSGDTYCETDFSGVPALQEQMLKQAKSLVIMTGRPLLDVNEGRKPLEQAFGIGPRTDPEEDADKLYMPATIDAGTVQKGQPGVEPGSGEGDEIASTEAQTDEPSKPKAAKSKTNPARAMERLVSLRKQRSAMLARYERRFERAMRGFFTSQEERVLAKLQAAWSLSGISRSNGNGAAKNRVREALKRDAPYIDFDALLDENDHVDRAQLERIFNELMAERGEDALAEVGVEVEIELNGQRVKRYADREAAQVLTQTAETTRSRLRAALSDVLKAGGTYDDAYAAVQSVFEGRRLNAATIARTEMIGAYNYASLDAAGQSGVVTGKTWLTAEDELVREAHSHAEEEGAVALDEGWTMDSSEGPVTLQFPGDPDAPPDLRCNCRCTLNYETDLARVAVVKKRYAESGRRRRMADAIEPDAPLAEWIGL